MNLLFCVALCILPHNNSNKSHLPSQVMPGNTGSTRAEKSWCKSNDMSFFHVIIHIIKNRNRCWHIGDWWRGISGPNLITAFMAIHPDSKVHGANMGPIWGRQDPGGSHVGPMNFAIWAGVGSARVNENTCSKVLIFNLNQTILLYYHYYASLCSNDSWYETTVMFLINQNWQ